MAIRPVTFNADGSIEVWHDEGGHGGRVPLGALQLGRLPGAATPDQRTVTVSCPVAGCGSSSTHPLVGGVVPREVQRAIVRALLASGLSGVPRTWATLKPTIKQLVLQLGGIEAWLWESDDPTA